MVMGTWLATAAQVENICAASSRIATSRLPSRGTHAGNCAWIEAKAAAMSWFGSTVMGSEM